MSFLPVEWAAEHSPVSDPYERLLLIALARRANSDGTDSYPSRNTLAKSGLCDKSTVTRRLGALEARGLIREGDQQAAWRIPEHLRPKVYDVLIPFSFYSPDQMEKVNQERVDRGLAPLRPEDRPDLGPAPEKKARADKGTKRPKRDTKDASKSTASEEGGASSTPGASNTPLGISTDSPEFAPGASSTRVLEALRGGASSTPNLSFNSVLSSSSAPPENAAVSGEAPETEKKKIDDTNTTDGLAVPSAAAVPEHQDEPDPADPGDELSSEVRRIVSAWSQARIAAGVGPHRRAGALEEFQASATALVKAGRSVEWLIAVARWMAAEKPAWAGLGEASKAQYAGAPAAPVARPVPRQPVNRCPSHPSLEAAGCRHCAADEIVDRQRRELDAQRGIDDESSLQLLAALIQRGQNPRSAVDRSRDAAARQAEEARRQSAKRAEYLAG
ncbi:helix-turn-helix domain-containing protein [Kitasatospora purpeofusca]|uniref:helix-turn-helix domain-containing protein n=1 Tax=Kitasatospora purpeofusca TaxID=67352 RepID=UPI0035DF9586